MSGSRRILNRIVALAEQRARRASVVGAALLAAFFLLRLAGCYPNPDDLRGASASGSSGCAEFAASWCAKFKACQPAAADYTFGDSATCRQRMAGYCSTILTNDVDSGWFQPTLAACSAGWSALSCAEWINDPSEFPGTACRVPGKRPSGGSCFRNLQCATNNCVFANDTDSCGKCGPLAAQGQPCTSSIDCAIGLGCSDSGACAPWGKIGDACGADRPCLNTLQCSGGTCAALGGPGASCSATFECDFSQGLLCNITTDKCGAAVASTTCDDSQADGKVRYCAAGGRCNSDGTCTAAASDGQACSDSGALCVFPAFCSSTAGVCKQPTPVACTTTGTDAGTTPPGDGGAIGDTAVTLFASALCNHLQTCAPRRVTQIYGSQAGCEVRLKLGINRILSLPDTGWTVATLSACSTAELAQMCPDANDGKLPTACMVAGLRANGRACRAGDQCASLRCSATDTACGQCLARGTAGAACTSDGDCDPAFICAVGTGGGLCVSPGGSGAVCNPSTAPCRYSLSCRGGVCLTPGTGATSCTDHEDCDDRNGWLCNGTTGRCALAIAAATCGGAASDGTVPYCSNSAYCNSSAVCVPAAADNQACDAAGAHCLPPATCVRGVCTLPSTIDCP